MKTLLNLIPNAVGWVTSNVRLIIEYALIAIIVTLCGTTLAMWSGKTLVEKRLLSTEKSLIQVGSRLETVETINEIQEGTITTLKTLRDKDSEIMSKLVDGYDNLVRQDGSVRARLSNLEQSNEAVREYLDKPIPPDLACLLNATTCAAKGGNGSRVPAAASKPAEAVR